jgi:deoxynucleoside triphosphate triphosphohydrolase SAMHD1
VSVEAVRRLRATWQANADLQGAIEHAFDEIGFDEGYVRTCVEAAAAGSEARKTKCIKDNVWGMVEVDWRTVRLLDCPIVQRLRGIKQLGLSYLTYPSAEHSRFIHSLGMAHVVTTLLKTIDGRAVDAEGGLQEDNLYIPIRNLAPVTQHDIVHAAILHDVGHMPFSHATERVLEGQENIFTCGPSSVGDLLAVAQRTLTTPIRLAEVLSILVVLSNRFSSFYSGFVRRGDEEPDALLRIGSLIAGLPPEPKLSGIAEVISSAAVDADKIDYVNRDAHACGIPVGVDVSRIFLRSGFIQADRARLQKSGLKDDPAAEEILFVVNASGMDTIDEITQARAALYQRVYLHAVTRTAEAILARTLVANANSTEKESTAVDALSLWSTNDNALLAKLVSAPDQGVKFLARRLSNRLLPKKGCVFSASVATMHMPLLSIFRELSSSDARNMKKQVAHTPLESLTNDKIAAGMGANLEDQIISEISRLTETLRASGAGGLVPSTPLQLVIVVGTAYMDRVRKDCIVLQNGELLRTSQFTNVREQQDAFDIFKAVGYVMCDADWRPLVLTAARTVLAAPVGAPTATLLAQGDPDIEDKVSFIPRVILDLRGVIRRSGVKREKINAVTQAATDAGYFEDKPLLAQPTDPEGEPVRRVTGRIGRFEGQRSWRVREETVAAFIDQFPPRLRSLMLEMLGRMVFFDTAELRTSILNSIAELAGPVDVAPLSPNSGNFVRTTLEQEARGQPRYERARFRHDIHEALGPHYRR